MGLHLTLRWDNVMKYSGGRVRGVWRLIFI